MDGTSEADAAGIERSTLCVTDEAGARRRRVRSDAQKVKIVEALMKPGASIGEISARYGVHSSLLCRWRRQHGQGLLKSGKHSAGAARLIPVSIRESSPEQADAIAAEAGSTPGRIAITFSGGRQLQLHGAVELATLRTVLQELHRA